MSSSHSVTKLITDLKAGNPLAAQQIWDRYVNSLIRVANNRLRTAAIRIGDEEDAVVMAFTQFLNRLDVGGFSKLDDRSDLWRILVVLTERRALDMIRRENTQKSGGKLRVGEPHGDGSISPLGMDSFASPEPSPEFATMLLEEFNERVNQLGKPDLKKVATLKMNGYNNQEVSGQLGISLRSVERKLKLIREIWQDELSDDEKIT